MCVLHLSLYLFNCLAHSCDLRSPVLVCPSHRSYQFLLLHHPSLSAEPWTNSRSWASKLISGSEQSNGPKTDRNAPTSWVPNDLAVTAKQRKFRVGQLVLDVLRQRLLSVRMLGHAGWRRRLWGCLMALRCFRFRYLKSHSLQKTFTINSLIHSSHTLHMAAQCSEHSNKFGPATCSSAKAQWHSDKEKASESWTNKVKICKNDVHGY